MVQDKDYEHGREPEQQFEYEPVTQELKRGYFILFPELCKGCGLCIEKCPKKCIAWSDVPGVYGTPTVEASDECIACGICRDVCPDCAITIAGRRSVEH